MNAKLWGGSCLASQIEEVPRKAAGASFHCPDWRSSFCFPESERLKEQHWEHLLTDTLLLFSGLILSEAWQVGRRGQVASLQHVHSQTGRLFLALILLTS